MAPASGSRNSVAEESKSSSSAYHDLKVPKICMVTDSNSGVKVGYRDAMGEYHPPMGGEPLTTLCGSIPAPNHYTLPDMNLTMHAAPGFFMGSKKELKMDKVDGACSASYNPIYPPKCKTELLTTLKPRTEPPDYRCSPGPHKYLIKNEDVAQKPPKTTMKPRPPPTACFGPPNPLDRTIFTKTPGPKYDPITSHLPSPAKFRFNARNLPSDVTPGPGSGVRNIRGGPEGHRYSLCPLPTPLTPIMNNPGPGSYDPKITGVDPDPYIPTIGIKIPDLSPDQKPPPNAYNAIKQKRRAPALTFRPFEPEHDFRTPAPNSFFAEKLPKKIPPAFTLGRKLRKGRSYEDTHGGPAVRNIRHEPAQKPAFILTGKPRDKFDGIPAPNAYSPRDPPTTRRGFSITGLPPREKPAAIPAPNAYLPKAIKPRAPTFPLGIKHRDLGDKELEMVPSPAEYSLADGCGCSAFRQTKKGFSFKGRASKYMYSGFDMGRNMDKLPPQVESARKTIT